MSIFWARVGGFPWWPCRLASGPERDALLASLSQKAADKMQEKNCVVFLGSPLQKGWISNKSLIAFDEQSLLAKVVVKNLCIDQNYLEAVVEGCRISRHEGLVVPDDILIALRDAARITWQDFDEIDWNREDVCTACRGTEWSGESLLCDECNFSETHLHCLQEPLLQPPIDDWYCSPCAKLIVPVEEISSSVVENSSKPTSSGRSSKRAHEDATDGSTTGKKGKVGRKATSISAFHDAVTLSSVSANQHCRVCKVVGTPDQLVACTFPGCSMAYHPGCVYKRITFPLSDYPLQGAPHSSLMFDPWFCPSHFCASCSALEDPHVNQNPDTVMTPVGSDVPYPLFVISSGLHRGVKKQLHNCSMCPYSLCTECMDDVNIDFQHCQSDKIFRQVPTKSFSECGEIIDDVIVKDRKNPREAHIEKDSTLCCSLCINRDYSLQLARLLEKVLAVMFANKLSTPFLIPLLPGLEDFYDCWEGDSVGHLIDVLEKVRKFGYKSYDEFQVDLAAIREKVKVILANLYCSTHVSNSSDSKISAQCDRWVKNHCLLQSFDTVCDEAVHLSSDKLKQLVTLSKKVTPAELSCIDLPVHAKLWRAECSLPLPMPYRDMHFVPPRSEALWRKHMELSVSLTTTHPQVNEVVHELRASEDFTTKSTAEILLNIHGGDWDDESALPIEHGPSATTKSSVYSQNGARDTRELFQVLQESTRTAMLVQETLSRKFRESENIFRYGAKDVTIGDLNLLSELKLANDNLRWRLERQTRALNCSAALVESLQEQNADCLKKLDACQCQHGSCEGVDVTYNKVKEPV